LPKLLRLFKVIRDTWIRGKGWIRTERSGGFPFTVGQPFQLEFRAAPRNTIHVKFNYMLPFNDTNFISDICQQQIFCQLYTIRL